MRVDISWKALEHPKDPAWKFNCALYAIQHPTRRELLYLGKADGCTVRARFLARDKLEFWRALERLRGIYAHRMLVGLFSTKERLTRELVADIESVLIFGLQPWGNIAARKTRISRPGLVVRNRGCEWPSARKIMDTERHVAVW
jgi:hypothetical protein